MYIILLGDPTNGNVEYVGVFDDPVTASQYAVTHFKKKRWQLAYMAEKKN